MVSYQKDVNDTMSLLADKEALVKQSLLEFVQKHIDEASLSSIDDIVLSYVVSILEELGSQSPEEAFDVDQFTEMMSAYLPKFVEINSAIICQWMVDLAARISQGKDKGMRNLDDLFLLTSHDDEDEDDDAHHQTGEAEEKEMHYEMYEERIPRNHSTDSESDSDMDKQVQLLQEMFPTVCTLEVQHCLCIAEGSTETAAQLILHRQEAGENIVASSVQHPNQKTLGKTEQNDTDLRQHILSRYMYVDQSEDKKEHKPVAPKWEPKKLVRYRNNQIVSLKGEKYTEVKETESDDMKKTYVTLKPSRQYRFH